jgi:hypothetical protein
LEDTSVDGKMILKRILKTGSDSVDWVAAAESREKLQGCCDYSNEHSGSIKCGVFLDYMGNYQLLKKFSSPWSYTGYISTY